MIPKYTIVVDNNLMAFGKYTKFGTEHEIKLNLKLCAFSNELLKTINHELTHLMLSRYTDIVNQEAICEYVAGNINKFKNASDLILVDDVLHDPDLKIAKFLNNFAQAINTESEKIYNKYKDVI